MARTMLSVFASHSPAAETHAAPSQAPPLDEHAVASDSVKQETSTTVCVITKLGKTLALEGDFWVDEAVVLLGSVEGTFECGDSLTVGVGGSVVGDVNGRTVTIRGTVRGNVRGTESVVVMPGAMVTGDITAPRVTVIEGAQIAGALKTEAATTAPPSDIASADGQVGGALNEAAVERLLELLKAPRKS
jgi:cytoskeletal protein CcmA (bactofilin family)